MRSLGSGGAIGCLARRLPAGGMDETTSGRSLVACVDSMSRRALESPRETMGLEKTRRAGWLHTGHEVC